MNVNLHDITGVITGLFMIVMVVFVVGIPAAIAGDNALKLDHKIDEFRDAYHAWRTGRG